MATGGVEGGLGTAGGEPGACWVGRRPRGRRGSGWVGLGCSERRRVIVAWVILRRTIVAGLLVLGFLGELPRRR